MASTGITPGNDMRFQTEKLESARNFANKLWNASRFAIMNLQDDQGQFLPLTDVDTAALKPEDQWILDRLNQDTDAVGKALERFDLAMAGQKVYELIWNEFCDWYIELVKKRLWSDDEADKMVVRSVLVEALRNMVKLLHPFMPFITEEIWSHLPQAEGEDMLISATWPQVRADRAFPAAAKEVEKAMEVIRAIRNIRAEAEAAPSRKLSAYFLADAETEPVLQRGIRYLQELAGITEDITFATDRNQIPEDAMSAGIPGVEIFIPLEDLVDLDAEYDRLKKEQGRLEGEVKRAQGKLQNQGFLAKAPEKLVQEEKDKLAQYEDMLAKVSQRLALTAEKLGK